MYWLPIILVGLILLALEIKKTRNYLRVFIITIIATLLTGLTVFVDFSIKTSDVEVWSGQVVDWSHEEEYDEWHPEVCTTTTDNNGKTSTSCTPGYWEHHYAENYIKTSDNGWISVNLSPDGKIFDDNWPNNDLPLQQYWPLGTATASTHSYTNKVQASYSIYKHKDIDVKDFPDLPKYPSKVKDYVYIDRIVGEVPNKEEAISRLAAWNTELNKFIPDPEKPGKMRSWKQVNVIFVNVGINKPQDYGFALQDKWEGGNKNDFVVAFSLDENNDVIWTYPFSWSESEILKIEVRDYMNSLKSITDFVPVVDTVSEMVAEKFERKQFADFNYLQIEVSTISIILIWIMAAGAIFVGFRLSYLE